MKPSKHLKRVLQVISALLFLAFYGPAAAKAPKPSPSPQRTVTGSGLFLVDFDDFGNVTKVHVLKSTGDATLDATTIKTFYRWHGKRGVKRVKVPLTYTLTGPQSEVGPKASPAPQRR